jgi:hypothetical protein
MALQKSGKPEYTYIDCILQCTVLYTQYTKQMILSICLAVFQAKYITFARHVSAA